MSRPEVLRELTESYLKDLICEAAESVDPEFDPATPFKELGVDSFRVLKILRRLEEDFGSLPKTLLFENVNVEDLAAYFVTRHEPTLSRMFAGRLSEADETLDQPLGAAH